MMHYPEAVEALIAALKQLPGIGRRGAERLALSLLEWEPEKLEFLGRLLGTLPETVGSCPVCGALDAIPPSLFAWLTSSLSPFASFSSIRVAAPWY